MFHTTLGGAASLAEPLCLEAPRGNAARGRGRGRAGETGTAISNKTIREVLTKKETLEHRPEVIKKIIVKSFLKCMNTIQRIIRIIKDLAPKHGTLNIL